jgi:Acyl-CoA reductase (LuxC)
MDERYRDFEKTEQLLFGFSLQDRLAALAKLGDFLAEKNEQLEAVMELTYRENKWFILENQQKALEAIRTVFLDRQKLNEWVAQYPNLKETTNSKKTIAVIMAGNIPLVGFHDFLCVFVAGHKALLKLSDKDKYLFPFLLQKLVEIEPCAKDYFEVTERMTDFQGVIATGSNNTARYFEAYFSKYPHIIRKNRNSIAVLDGTETDEEIIALGHDIFDYFGLGCRSVSKLFSPKGYDYDRALGLWHEAFKTMVLHDKYKNNFDYNYALYMLNRTKFLINGCLILIEDKNLFSRIASIHYETYEDLQTLENQLVEIEDQLQCVSTKVVLDKVRTVNLGATQQPTLMDYPDGVDVMAFLVDELGK